MSKISTSKKQRYSVNPYIRTHSTHLLSGIRNLDKKVGNFYSNLFYSLDYEEKHLKKNLNILLKEGVIQKDLLQSINVILENIERIEKRQDKKKEFTAKTRKEINDILEKLYDELSLRDPKVRPDDLNPDSFSDERRALLFIIIKCKLRELKNEIYVRFNKMHEQRKMMSELKILKYLEEEDKKIQSDYSKVVNIRNFYMKASKKIPSFNMLNSFVSYSSSSSSGSSSGSPLITVSLRRRKRYQEKFFVNYADFLINYSKNYKKVKVEDPSPLYPNFLTQNFSKFPLAPERRVSPNTMSSFLDKQIDVIKTMAYPNGDANGIPFDSNYYNALFDSDYRDGIIEQFYRPQPQLNGGGLRNKSKHPDMSMKDIKELCKANQIKLSKTLNNSRVVYTKKELITKLKRKKLL